MSKTSAALEAAVAEVLALRTTGENSSTRRQQMLADRAFAKVMAIIAPRVRHFIKQYGLAAHWEDAEQCCAIGVHRAIQAYDPDKAQFTTFVNWQLRGELQSLRFRLKTDQRKSARKVEATTVSLHAGSINADGETQSLEAMIEDEAAIERTESGAAEHLAGKTRDALLDAYIDQLRENGLAQLRRKARSSRSVQSVDASLPRFRARSIIDPADMAELEQRLAMQRAIVERRLLGDGEPDDTMDLQERERQRQVAKRAARALVGLAERDRRFAGFEAEAAVPRRVSPAAVGTTIIPGPLGAQADDVVVIEPEMDYAEAVQGSSSAGHGSRLRRSLH